MDYHYTGSAVEKTVATLSRLPQPSDRRGRTIRVSRALLLGSAAVLATAAGAQAADLPTRKAAPVQYVKVCDTYGAGFFYIPGTDTCLRVGGLVLAQAWVNNTPYRIGSIGAPLPNYTGSAANLANGGVIPAGFQTGQSRDSVWWTALGRVELDARTQSPWGTVRAFLSVETTFGTGGSAATGSLSSIAPQVTPFQGTVAAKEATYINKAFIQFAGLTMGRIQSMFDFYADSAGAMTVLRGSNQTVNALAYTAVLGGGFTATLSLEDEVSHRARGTPWSTIAVPAAGGLGVVPAGLTQQFLGTRMPDVVANLRVDQAWGSAQVSGAIHRVGVGLYNGAAAPGLPVGQLVNKSDSIGYAVQAGVKFNLPMIAPGDALWLQATYGKGAIGYVDGTNFAFTYGIGISTNYGIGIARVSSGSYWFQGTDGDCVFMQSGSCDKSKSFAVAAAFKHYWTKTISTTLVASYYQVNYSNNALNPTALAAVVNGGAFTPGLTNYKEYLVGAGIQWSPIAAFTIASEFTWQRGITPRPIGLASDGALLAASLPAFKATSDLYRGRLRMIRAF